MFSNHITLGLLASIFLVLCNLASRSDALVPEECAHNITKPFSVCCPRNPRNGMVCGGPGRGYCDRVVPPKEMIPGVFLMDDRIAWPTRFFSHLCQCTGNFFGTSCNSCWFGWTGSNCDKRKIRIRKDIKKLSKRELFIFHDVVRRSQYWPSGFVIMDESTNRHSDPLFRPKFIPASVQYYITFSHRYGSRSTLYKNKQDCDNYGILNFNHDGVVFPTWHRYLSLVWERMLGEIAEKVHKERRFSMPYWDWTDLNHCDICTNTYIGAPGNRDEHGLHISNRSPFANLTEYCYEPEEGINCFGCQRSRQRATISREFNSDAIPTQSDIRFVLSLPEYFIPGERNHYECVSFNMALEGSCGPPDSDIGSSWMHNRLHAIMDGSMCCIGTATNDPIFMLHHNQIDRIFSVWMRMYHPKVTVFPNMNVRPGHSRDSFMIGFIPVVRNSEMFVDVRQLGYEYDDYAFGKHARNGRKPLVY